MQVPYYNELIISVYIKH